MSESKHGTPDGGQDEGDENGDFKTEIVAVNDSHGWAAGDTEHEAVLDSLDRMSYDNDGDDVTVYLYRVKGFEGVDQFGQIRVKAGGGIEDIGVLTVGGEYIDDIKEMRMAVDILYEEAVEKVDEDEAE